MRDDLNKLLCERERRGGWKGYRNYHPVRKLKKFAPDLDESGVRDMDSGLEDLHSYVGGSRMQEGMNRRYGGRQCDGKRFNENLSPLYHQVRKAVGKPWNTFYSELRKVFDMRSVINQHVLQHLYDYVEKDVFVNDDGDLVVRLQHIHEIYLKDCNTEFYVDPRDGIIKRNRAYDEKRRARRARKRAKQQEREESYRLIGERQALGKINGHWFVLDLAEVPRQADPTKSRNYVTDAFTGQEIPYWAPRRFYNSRQTNFEKDVPGTYHCSKRAAPKQLLKRYGLTCSPTTAV